MMVMMKTITFTILYLTGIVTGSNCTNKLDLCLIVDDGGSIGPTEWSVLMSFLSELSAQFTIGVDNTRVSLVTFSIRGKLRWTFNSDQTKDLQSLQSAFSDVKQSGSIVNFISGIETTMKKVLGQEGDRKDVPNVCILITDGRTGFRINDLPEVSNKLQQQAFIIALGITNAIDIPMLKVIATGEGEENVLFALNFQQLDNLLDKLISIMCPLGKPVSSACTDDPTWTLQGRVKATDEFGKKIRCKNCTCQQLKNKGSLILKKACTKRKFKKIVREKCCFSCKQNGFL